MAIEFRDGLKEEIWEVEQLGLRFAVPRGPADAKEFAKSVPPHFPGKLLLTAIDNLKGL
ncbi:hypothetical protein GCM10023155_01670 [Bremerella cremea]